MAYSATYASSISDTIETAIIAALTADTWFGSGGTGGIMSRTEHFTDIGSQEFDVTTLPALVVGAELSFIRRPQGTFGVVHVGVDVSIDYVENYGYQPDAYDKIQTVLDRLMWWVHSQMASGTGFNGAVATGEMTLLGDIVKDTIELPPEEMGSVQPSWLAIGTIAFSVSVSILAS